jgi:hypothetical protein
MKAEAPELPEGVMPRSFVDVVTPGIEGTMLSTTRAVVGV